jgi:hypothetical protein
MKRFLILSALAFLAFVAPATAANFNLVQPDTGTEFRATDPRGVEFSVPVGQIHLPVIIPDVTVAATRYVVVPVTSVRVSSILAVVEGQITTSNEAIRFWHYDTAGNLVGEITNGTSQLTFTSQAVTGTTKTLTPSTAAVNNMTKQHVIAISTLGASTGAAPASFMITLVPR